MRVQVLSDLRCAKGRREDKSRIGTPDRTRNLGCPFRNRHRMGSWGVRWRELRQLSPAGSKAGAGALSHPCFTPYWTTFELPAIDMKAASVGILDRIVTGLREWSLRRSRGGSRTCWRRQTQGPKTRTNRVRCRLGLACLPSFRSRYSAYRFPGVGHISCR